MDLEELVELPELLALSEAEVEESLLLLAAVVESDDEAAVDEVELPLAAVVESVVASVVVVVEVPVLCV